MSKKELFMKRKIAVLLLFLVFAFSFSANAKTKEAEENEYTSDNGLYVYTLDESGGAKIISYKGSETYIVLTKLDGKYNIISIEDGAFADKENLKKITLPTMVKSIGKNAFRGCTSLSEVVFSDSGTMLSEIKDGAFYGCKKLISIPHSENLEKIGAYAFYGCVKANTDTSEFTRLSSIGDFAFAFCGTDSEEKTEMKISSSVTEIGNGAFFGCVNIKSFSADGNKSFESDDGVLFADEKNVLIAFPAASEKTEYSIPSSVKKIADNAFAFSRLENLDFSKFDGDIGSYSFFSSAIEEAILYDGVKSIGAYAFSECKNLEKVEFSSKDTEISHHVFYGCEKLVSVSLPQNISFLPDGTFSDCSSLLTVTLSENTVKIGANAFYGCSSLVSLSASSLSEIGDFAFYGCTSLKEIDLSDVSVIGAYCFKDCRALSDIKTNIKDIPAYAFYGCVSIENADFINNAEKIGNYAFYGCTSIKSLPFSERLEKIGDFAFSECDALEEVTIPKSVTYIGKGIFSGCNIKSAVINAYVSTLPSKTFYGCKKLSYIRLSDSVKNIGDYSFYGCVLIEDIECGKIEHVGAYAFHSCRSLTRAVIGSNDDKISAYTFFGCDSIKEIDMPENIKKIDMYAFSSCSSLSLLDTRNVEYIAEGAFSKCTELERVFSSAFIIGENAFYGCSKLSDFQNTKAVYIAPDALKSTKWLSSSEDEYVVSGDGVLIAFKGEKTKSLVIPATVKRIPEGIFTYLSDVDEITLPESVRFIAKYAFTETYEYTTSSGSIATGTKIRHLTLHGKKGSFAEAFSRYEYYNFKK